MSPRVFVPGTHAPQGSKTRGKHGLYESSKKVGPWRERVALAVAEMLSPGPPPTRRPVVVSARFLFLRPKSHYGSGRNAEVVKPSAPRVPATRPDLDKLVRAVLDALTGVAIADDAQVVSLNAGKEYANVEGVELRWDVLS